MGHAFAFLFGRIFEGRVTPIVPIMLNTYYPPNQPSPERCYAIGQGIRKAIEGWDNPARVAVIGSGGLSHFVVNEGVDQTALNSFATKNMQPLYDIPRPLLNSGSSEIRNWVVAAGAAEHLNFELIEYVPSYRSPAGTGGGWAFARWT